MGFISIVIVQYCKDSVGHGRADVDSEFLESLEFLFQNNYSANSLTVIVLSLKLTV